MKDRKKTKIQSKSIKKRLVGNFMIVILISVVIFEVLLFNFTRYYFYNTLEGTMTNQIKISAEYYSRYFSNVQLEYCILHSSEIFLKQTTAQVQIIDPLGNVLLDSIGYISTDKIESSDFKEAAKGKKGRWIGKFYKYKSKAMAISYPLESSDKVVGVIRYVTSLNEVDRMIRKVYMIFLAIGIIVICVAGLVSVFLADSVIYPITEVTKVAQKMADGNLSVRINKTTQDEIGKLSDTLNFMADEIEKKNAIKNEFISSISHELRTPLTAIKGWAIILNDEEFQDKYVLQDGLNIIEKESERLTILVEQLLDFSKFASGRITLKKEATEISSIIEYIDKCMRPRAKREGINFKVIYDNKTSLVTIDIDRIKQVLINILDNAFKFTPHGKMVILSVIQEENYLVICVKDSGYGISEEEIPKVKEKFYKGQYEQCENGLGLSICDEIIKIHEGILLIESKLGEGTTVYVKLPLSEKNI